MTLRRSALLLALGPYIFVGSTPTAVALVLTEPERAAKPKSNHERLKVQPRYTAMKARTRR